jgi:hypothetical protein
MLGVVVFQAALVLGAPWGEYTQGGQVEEVLDASGRVLAAVSCAILLVMAAAMLARVREGPLKGAPPTLHVLPHGISARAPCISKAACFQVFREWAVKDSNLRPWD